MPQLTTKDLANLTRLLDRSLQDSYKDALAGSWAPQFAKGIQVSKREIDFPWVYDVALLEETDFSSPPAYKELSGTKATLKLRIWQDAVRINAYDLTEDDTGQLLDKAADIGWNAGILIEDLILDALKNGDSSAYVMYDGQNYFANAHVKKGAITYDNLLGLALSATNFQAARTQMQRFPSDLGTDRPLKINPTHLIVPSELEYTARELMNNTWNPADNKSTENVLKSMATVIADPRLTDANDWYLIANGSRIKPFFHLKHKDYSPFRIYPETSDDSPAFRDNHERRWWGRTVENVYPTHPYLAIKSVV